MNATTFKHVTKDFQRMTKTEQAQHLRDGHDLEVTDEQVARRAGGWTPAAETLYQRHVTAHAG